jgi:hypothetical protein
MIDVRVRQNDRVEFARVSRELTILLVRLRALPLEEAEVQGNCPSTDVDEMAGTGNFARCTSERDLHDEQSPVFGDGRAKIVLWRP